jgi:hypothetical protein
MNNLEKIPGSDKCHRVICGIVKKKPEGLFPYPRKVRNGVKFSHLRSRPSRIHGSVDTTNAVHSEVLYLDFLQDVWAAIVLGLRWLTVSVFAVCVFHIIS